MTYQFLSLRGASCRYQSAGGTDDRILEHVDLASNAPDPERRSIALHCLLREMDERIGAARAESYARIVKLWVSETMYDEPDRDEPDSVRASLHSGSST
jgi:hypothetical protein